MTQDEIMKLCDLLDDRYVMQADCNERQESVNRKFANDDKRIDKLLDKMAMWDKLLWVIASAAVGGLATAILNLIIK